jgi:hypothetical protein
MPVGRRTRSMDAKNHAQEQLSGIPCSAATGSHEEGTQLHGWAIVNIDAPTPTAPPRCPNSPSNHTPIASLVAVTLPCSSISDSDDTEALGAKIRGHPMPHYQAQRYYLPYPAPPQYQPYPPHMCGKSKDGSPRGGIMAEVLILSNGLRGPLTLDHGAGIPRLTSPLGG